MRCADPAPGSVAYTEARRGAARNRAPGGFDDWIPCPGTTFVLHRHAACHDSSADYRFLMGMRSSTGTSRSGADSAAIPATVPAFNPRGRVSRCALHGRCSAGESAERAFEYDSEYAGAGKAFCYSEPAADRAGTHFNAVAGAIDAAAASNAGHDPIHTQ